MGISSRAVLLASSAFASLGVFTFAAAQVPQAEPAAPWYRLAAPICVAEPGEGAQAWSYTTSPVPMQSQRPPTLE